MNKHYPLVAIVAAVCASVTLNAHAALVDSRDKPFNEYSWVTTHNSYEKINQNLKEMPAQLRDGVRGFMIDIYPDTNAVRPELAIKVCHKQLACYGAFSSQLKNEFIPFLKANPTEVVTIFLETYVSREQLQQVFNTLPDLASLSFNPENFPAARWPTLREMAAKNNRLIFLTDKFEIAGNYMVQGKPVTVLFDQDWLVQNDWSTLGLMASNIEKAHNWSCPTRWSELPLTTKLVDPSTKKQWKRLFLMNQFHHGTSTTMDSAKYDNNMTYLQRRQDNCGVVPNFVGVNNYGSGEADRYVSGLNNGGIYLYEGDGATKKEDIVCVIPVKAGVVNRKANGCENDEARSMSLSGVAKGTRITLYDNPAGDTQDDHLIVDVLRDIRINEHLIIPSFEQDRSEPAYRAVFNRNNGLNGKVSRIEIGKTPQGFADASIALYEGNNASQNLDCVVPFSSHHNLKMKSNSFGCSNDEIRSAKIIKAKAGSMFTLTGHPEGRHNEGRTDVEILRDITAPLVIPSFNHHYETLDVRVTNHTQPIDGKISFGYIRGEK